MQVGIFTLRKGGLLSSLISGKEKFYELNLENQCKVLQNIIVSFAPSTQNISLELLGEAAHVGTIYLPKTIEKLNSLVLINQSVTGLFKNEVDLLHL